MDEEIIDTGAGTGGFWGDDGFTFDDLGSIIELGTDTTEAAGNLFGWWDTSETTDFEETAPGYYEPTSSTSSWIWWAAGGVLLLLIIFLVYWYVTKKQGKK